MFFCLCIFFSNLPGLDSLPGVLLVLHPVTWINKISNLEHKRVITEDIRVGFSSSFIEKGNDHRHL